MGKAGSNQINIFSLLEFSTQEKKNEMGRTNNVKENELYQNMR